MFADACEKAAEFTRPVIISTRSLDGTVSASCGAFVVLNDDGWIMTAGHIFDSYTIFQGDQNKIREVDSVNANRRPGSPEVPLRKDPKWLTNHSFWWGWDGVRLTDAYVNRMLDFTVGRLQPFKPEMISRYPTIRDPETLRPGTSICRLGFPFSNIESEFDSALDAFRIKRGVLPLPLFPNDGIHTRNVMNGVAKDNYEMLYVETSTPGLKGQSGGPIFDKDGNIYALQVQTAHFPLGFQPVIEVDGKRVVENQFINVGLGVHPKTILRVLRDRNVKYSMQGEESGYRIH